MDLTMTVVCEEARERTDGKLDVVGVFSELVAPGFPAVQQRMTVVFVMEWQADETGTQAFRADLEGPGGRPILTIEGETEVGDGNGSGPPRTRLILPLEQVVFPVAGRYRFQLVAGGDTHTGCSLFLSERPR